MRFIICNHSYEITRNQILDATRGITPNPFDGRNKFYIELHGLKYPIKQPIHLVTGLPYTGPFGSQDAQRILNKLGFTVHSLQSINEVVSTYKTVTNTDTIEGTKKFAVTLEQDEDGFIVVACPALPGCYSQGRTDVEAIANIKEAIRGYVASMRRHGETVPSVKEIREIEVPV